MGVAWSSKRARRRGSFPIFVLIRVISISSPSQTPPFHLLWTRWRLWMALFILPAVRKLCCLLSATEVTRDECVLLADHFSPYIYGTVAPNFRMRASPQLVPPPLATGVGRAATLGSAKLLLFQMR